MLLAVVLPCLLSMFLTLGHDSRVYYDQQNFDETRLPPDVSRGPAYWFGTDTIGRSLLGRCLLGGVISLGIGAAAATLSVLLGVTVGLLAGYRGGWVDALLMRTVDVMYGLPYILLIVLFKIALEQPLTTLFHSTSAANLVVLFLAIGLVSWLTMARVVRGQVSEPARPAVHRSLPRRRADRVPYFHPPPASELDRPHHRVRHAHGPPGDFARELSELSGHRHPTPHAHLGRFGQRGIAAVAEHRQAVLVDAHFPLLAAGVDTAEPQFPGRRPA